MKSFNKLVAVCWLVFTVGTLNATEAASNSTFLPGDKVLAALNAEGEDGVKVVKAGTTVILNGQVKKAKTKYTIWRLKQSFGNIVDLTSMDPQAFKDLQAIEASFSEELALSFDAQAQKSLSGSLKFRVVEGRLVVTGKANNAEDIERITNIAKVYDSNPVINLEVRRDMIEIDAIFCRVNRNNGQAFGTKGLQSATITVPKYDVTYNGTPNHKSFNDASEGDSGTYKNNGWNLGLQSGTAGFLNSLTAHFQVTEKDVKLLVRPHLSTLNGQEAIFHSGGQQPFEIATNNVQNIEWKDYGTKLTVKPMLTTDGLIDIQVNLEFIIPLNDAQKRFTKFSHNGRAILGENQALVLSGLIQQLYSLDMDRTPGLSRVPILNYFFGNKGLSHDQDEMVVIVMPRKTETVEPNGLDKAFRSAKESGEIIEETQGKMGEILDMKKNSRPQSKE